MLWLKEVLVVNFQNINEKASDLFAHIDQVKDKYGIINYTVSTTELEDVFLKLNRNEASKNLFNSDYNTIPNTDNDYNKESINMTYLNKVIDNSSNK